MKTFVIILAIVAILILLVYSYFGGFHRITPRIEVQGGETLVYKKVTGDYKQTGKAMDSIYYQLLNGEKTETFKGFGIYYDDPQKVEKSQLRSEAGCILEKVDSTTVEYLSKKFNLKRFPEDQYIVAAFPYKGKFSVIFSIFKVYPALNKFAKENHYSLDTPVMEIYDVPNKKIIYRKMIQN
jgi:DNA gyrase inhibitor GyrI